MTREERIIEIAKIIQDGELKGQRNGTKITYNTDDIVAYGMQRLFGAEALDNAGYRKEQDLLKEFVEFAKGEFIKANYCYNDTYLDTMLDMFMEDRK